MKDYVSRMVAESEELSAKINKLEDFIKTHKFDELQKEKQELLEMQFYAMKTYQMILQKRLDIELAEEN